MEILYDWLLHNTGNEGNFYTILNCQRNRIPNKSDELDVRARSSDFIIKHILLWQRQDVNSSETELNWVQGKIPTHNLLFTDPQQIIHFFSTGEIPEPTQSANKASIQVIIAELDGERL